MIMTNRTNILINDSGTDLSAEGYAALGVLLEMVWGIQTMGARMARSLDEIGARNCLVQRKKQAFNDAKKSINGLLKGLEAAFDETFNYAMCRVPESIAERTEALQSYADDIVRLLILYYSRVDGDPQGNDKRQRVHKAIANFKPVPGFDAEALIRFFKMRYYGRSERIRRHDRTEVREMDGAGDDGQNINGRAQENGVPLPLRLRD